MRLLAYATLAAASFNCVPAHAAPVGAAEPPIELRLAPTVLPRGDILSERDEWDPGAPRLSAIVGPYGAAPTPFRAAETFDDSPLDEDAGLAASDYDDM